MEKEIEEEEGEEIRTKQIPVLKITSALFFKKII